MVQHAKEKLNKRPPNRAQRPMIWQDSMAEVKETFRRVAMVKHAGFSVWEDPRRGPTLERVLRWNRQARNLSQVPKSLREKIPPKILKEIQNNRSVSGFVSQTHLQNVKGMCQRIHSQKSHNERRKNPYDPSMYPVFVRRPPTVACCLMDASELDTSPRNLHSHYRSRRRPYSSPVVDYRAPLSYTPQPLKLLYDISNAAYAKRPRSGGTAGGSSATSCYGRLFNRAASAMAKKSVMDIAEALERQRVSSAPARQQRCSRRLAFPSAPSPPSTSSPGSTAAGRKGETPSCSSRSNYDGDSRPPSRCTNRPSSSRSSWRINLVEPPALDDLTNRSTYSDCVSLDSLGMPVLFSSATTPQSSTSERPRVPKLRLRGGGGGSPRKARLTSSALTIVEGVEQSKKQKKQEREEVFSVLFSDDEDVVRVEQRPATANVPPLITNVLASDSDSFSDCNWRPQSASNAVGRRCSRVTFASPVESSRWENRARFGMSHSSSGVDTSDEVEEEIVAAAAAAASAGDDDVVEQQGFAAEDEEKYEEEEEAEEQQEGEEEEEKEEAMEEEEEVIIKHSSDPYVDFKRSMMSMIESEGLREESQELEQLFQYYMDLNPKMHHPILTRVIQDIKAELKNNRQYL